MHYFQFLFMCLYIAAYKSFELSGASVPSFMPTVNLVFSGGFLLWSAFQWFRVTIDCIRLYFRKEMSPENVRNGILLVTLDLIPALLMSVFMLTDSFREN